MAVAGSTAAGQYILAGASVLPMGGFSGSVPFPTTDQLAALVATGELRYVLDTGVDGRDGAQRAVGLPGRGGDAGAARTAWVSAHCTVVDAVAYGGANGGMVLYDCAPR
jgi:hypothetical protein